MISNRTKLLFAGFSLMGLLSTSTLLAFAQSVPNPEQPFADVNKYSRYYTSTLYLKNKGVIQGYDDGTFKTSQKVNRAEALKIILLGSNENTNSSKPLPFPDTASSAWYAPFVSTGLDLGVVQGYPDGTFKPEQTVNKVESLKMLLKTTNTTPPTVTLSDASLFDDTPIGNDTLWYQPYVFYASQKNIIDPPTISTFAPSAAMTRGEIAEMMYRINIIQDQNLQKFDTSQAGTASYYGLSAEGDGTASGQPFSNDDFSAAHLYLPFGDMLKVINTTTGLFAFVQVNDRGPYVDGRILDLSQSAFAAIGNLSQGLAQIRMVPLGVFPGISKGYIATDTFLDTDTRQTGVVLDKKIPNLFLPNEAYTITGSTPEPAKTVTALVTDKKTKKQKVFVAAVNDHRFNVSVLFGSEGNYTLNIIPDTRGLGYADVSVVNGKYFENPGDLLPNSNAPGSLKGAMQNSKAVISWDRNSNTLFRLHFTQPQGQEKIFYVNNSNTFEVPYSQFSDFKSGETVSTFIEGAKSSTEFSMDRYTTWAKSDTWNFTAVQHEYEIYQQDKVVLNPFNQFVTENKLQLQGVGKITLESAMWYIPPSGLPVQTTDNIYPTISSGTQFTLTIPFDQNGTFIAEINDTNGEAVFNYPFYKTGTFPLLPNPRDKEENLNLVASINVDSERNKMLASINAERTKLGLSSLVVRDNVNNLAQARSDDMANRNYFSHVTPEGKTAADLAPEYNVPGSDIGENIAKDNNPLLALYGLFRSAAHRNLMLSTDFQSVGIGLSKAKDGQVVVVQIFN